MKFCAICGTPDCVTELKKSGDYDLCFHCAHMVTRWIWKYPHLSKKDAIVQLALIEAAQ